MNPNFGPEKRAFSVTCDTAPEGSTYESLLKEGWKEVYSFNLRQSDHISYTQQKVDEAKSDGRYTVVMVPSENPEDAKYGVRYILKKLKTST